MDRGGDIFSRVFGSIQRFWILLKWHFKPPFQWKKFPWTEILELEVWNGCNSTRRISAEIQFLIFSKKTFPTFRTLISKPQTPQTDSVIHSTFYYIPKNKHLRTYVGSFTTLPKMKHSKKEKLKKSEKSESRWKLKKLKKSMLWAVVSLSGQNAMFCCCVPALC